MSDAASDLAAPALSSDGEPRRRSKGQLAMAAAISLPATDRSTGRDAGISKTAVAAGVSRARLHQALVVREYVPHLVSGIASGQVTLDRAYATALEHRRSGGGSVVKASDRCEDSSDRYRDLEALQPPLVLRTKRNSGRTGPKRLTSAEVAQRDQHAAADHRRRYGQPLPVNDAPMPPPPKWFTRDQRAIWEQTLATAPPGLLRAGDADNLAVLCSAIDLHRRLTRQLAGSTEVPEPELIRQLRQVGTEVGRASKLLGLTPPERARIGLPMKTEQELPSALSGLQTFPKVVTGGKAA